MTHFYAKCPDVASNIYNFLQACKKFNARPNGIRHVCMPKVLLFDIPFAKAVIKRRVPERTTYILHLTIRSISSCAGCFLKDYMRIVRVKILRIYPRQNFKKPDFFSAMRIP